MNRIIIRPVYALSRVPRCNVVGAPTTRLQWQAQQLVAIDAEYAHVLITSSHQRLQIPVEVCIVDAMGNTLFHSCCNGFDAHNLTQESVDWEFKGGLPVKEWIDAPLLAAIRPHVVSILNAMPDRLVVGHNVAKDLAALGIDIPLERRRDTMRYAALQGPSGFGKKLSELAEKKLGRSIQQRARHDPAEDARAALDLYLNYCHFDPRLMAYEDLVEYYSSELLANKE